MSVRLITTPVPHCQTNPFLPVPQSASADGAPSGPERRRGIDKEMAGSSLEDEDMLKVLDRVRSGDRPPQRCLEVAQRLLLKKHDQLKRETMLLIEAAAVIAGGVDAAAATSVLGATSPPKLDDSTGGVGRKEVSATVVKKSTATILVSKNKTKLPLLLKIK